MRRLLLALAALLVFAPPAHAAWVWPVSGEVITPYRNGSDPYASGQHRGIDIAAPAGTPVVAASGGEVRFAGTAGSSGVTVSVRTGDGYDTSYLHLSSLAVRPGAHVTAGERIGAVGTSGTRSSSAPHLHFGVRDAGTRHAYRDPLGLLPPPLAAPSPSPPGGAPLPVAEQAPPAPAPAPISPPLRGPQPAPARGGQPAPLGSPRPEPLRGSRPVPFGDAKPAPVGHRQRDPVPRRSADARGERLARPGLPRLEVPTARAEPTASRHTSPLETRATPHIPTPVEARQASGGPGIGRALACAGLLLAAGLLGLSGGGRRSPRRPAARVRVASAVDAVLRHHAHLLRERRASSWARVHDDRG